MFVSIPGQVERKIRLQVPLYAELPDEATVVALTWVAFASILVGMIHLDVPEWVEPQDEATMALMLATSGQRHDLEGRLVAVLVDSAALWVHLMVVSLAVGLPDPVASEVHSMAEQEVSPASVPKAVLYQAALLHQDGGPALYEEAALSYAASIDQEDQQREGWLVGAQWCPLVQAAALRLAGQQLRVLPAPTLLHVARVLAELVVVLVAALEAENPIVQARPMYHAFWAKVQRWVPAQSATKQ